MGIREQVVIGFARILYGPIKSMGVMAALVSAGPLAAQIPWQSSPAQPAPLNLTRQNEASSLNKKNSMTGVSNAKSPANATTANGLQPPVVNRYAPQMIPFNPGQASTGVANLPINQFSGPPQTINPLQPAMTSAVKPPMGTMGSPGVYVPSDLPPPPSTRTTDTSVVDPVEGLINAVPAFATAPGQSDASPIGRINSRELPAAGQLLPRNVVTSPTGPQPTGTFGSGLSQSTGGQGTVPFGSGVGGNQTVPVPDLKALGGTSGFKLAGFDSTNPVVDNPAGQIISDMWNTKLVAIVGTERILAGDLAAIIEPIIYENSSRFTSKRQENDARQTLLKQLLPQFIELKALQQEFYRDIAGNVSPKELAKKKEEIHSRASKAFFDKYVPIELYRRYKVEDLGELEAKLHEKGLSLAISKNHFLTQFSAMQLENKYVAESFEIPPGEILAYYQQHQDKWQIPARAKWRELAVRFDKHGGNRQEAENQIKNLGNEVVLGGKPFEAVARDSSEGFTAAEGGLHDWTTQGSLKSNIIDQALFVLPTHRLSQIIEDEVGFHIVEVLEREQARTQDMSEIQTEIRQKLSDQIRQQKLDEFRDKVVARTPIWSKWPEDMPGAKPLDLTFDSETP